MSESTIITGAASEVIVRVTENEEGEKVGAPFAFIDYNPDMCRVDGKEHQWDGEWRRDAFGGYGATCSKCGMDFITWGMANLP